MKSKRKSFLGYIGLLETQAIIAKRKVSGVTCERRKRRSAKQRAANRWWNTELRDLKGDWGVKAKKQGSRVNTNCIYF